MDYLGNYHMNTASQPFKTGTKAQFGMSGQAEKLVKHNRNKLTKRGGLRK